MKPVLLRPVLLAAFLAPSLVALPSFASEAYPAVITSTLKLKSVPQCTLCHASNLGGSGTINTKFGRSLMMRGVSGNSNVRALTNALGKDTVDSDGDSVFDIAELRDGSDPNVADREPPPPPDPDPLGEGGSAGAPHNGGAGSVPGQDPETEGGATATASGGTSAGGRTSGGGPTLPQEPEVPEIAEIPALQTGCGLATSTPSGVSGLLALALLGLLRSRRQGRRRSRSHK